MNPSMSLLNLTPSSYGFESAALGLVGTVDGFHRLGHGHAPTTTDTLMPGPADSRFPLSSTARVRMVADPRTAGDQSKLHVEVPDAACHVVPPSTDTSTLATTPPPLSAAVPLIVTRLPFSTWPPAAGEVTPDVGAKISLDALVATSGRAGSAPACSAAGCAPLSASGLAVPCCIACSGTCASGPPRSWSESSPHAHCTVPAPKTRAPLLWRY